jgi:hypothetical protein
MLASVIYSGLLIVGVIRDRRRHGFKPKLWTQRTGWRLLWDRVSEAWPPRYFISVTLVVVVGMMSIGLMFSGLSRGTVPADVKHELVSRADVAVRNEQLLVAGVDRYSRNDAGALAGDVNYRTLNGVEIFRVAVDGDDATVTARRIWAAVLSWAGTALVVAGCWRLGLATARWQRAGYFK